MMSELSLARLQLAMRFELSQQLVSGLELSLVSAETPLVLTIHEYDQLAAAELAIHEYDQR